MSAKVTTADMQWLEQHLGARGFTPHLARVTMDCHLADFESAFPTVIKYSPPMLSLQREESTV